MPGPKYVYRCPCGHVGTIAEGFITKDPRQAMCACIKCMGNIYTLMLTGERVMNEKTLHNSNVNGAHKNVPDLKVYGDGDLWRLLCKASSEVEGWMKSTKVMKVGPLGCLVQVTTQQRNPDGSYAVAEAVTFVPKAMFDNFKFPKD